MQLHKPAIAITQLVLIFPAALFMTALLARYLQPIIYEPAQTAQRIVMWYSGRVWTLWVLLIGLPLVVLVIGCVTWVQNGIANAKPRQTTSQQSTMVRFHPATIIMAALTLLAGIILGIVAVHMLMN